MLLGVLLSSVPSLVGPSGPYHSHPMGDVSLPITQRPGHPCASLAREGVRASGRQSYGLWETGGDPKGLGVTMERRECLPFSFHWWVGCYPDP